jgi:hypothetical protein
MENTFATDWTKEEFKAYLLLYAAKANFFEDELEREMILSMVNPSTFKRIHREINQDNDYQSIQKILLNVKKYHYSQENIEHLILDIQKVFDASEKEDLLEGNMLRGLKRLLK